MNLPTVKYLGQKAGELGLAPAGGASVRSRFHRHAPRTVSLSSLPLRPGTRMRDGSRLPGPFEDSLASQKIVCRCEFG
jgi:hypothetical protein